MRVTATLLLWGMCCLGAQGSSITYITPAGSTNPMSHDPVDATVTFTTETGMIMVTLENLEANPKEVGQSLSDLRFTVSNGTVTSASLGSGSAGAITIISGGAITMPTPLDSASEVGWVLSEPSSTDYLLNVLGTTVGPAHTIIGPPASSGVYSNAHGSIAGNHPHNPFIEITATWMINASNVSSDTTITAVTFSFGTEAGENVMGSPVAVIPEPSSMMLLGSGLLVFTQVLRRQAKAEQGISKKFQASVGVAALTGSA